VELVVSLAILFIISAIAIPSIMRTLQFYQLNDGATRLASIIKFTRFEAIRRNAPVACQFQQTGANWIVWTDSNGNGQPDATETQTIFNGVATFLPTAANPGPIAATLGTLHMNVISGGAGFVAFDPRGSVTLAGAPVTAVNAFYLGNAGDPNTSFRAVVVLPSGATQVWASSASGDWRRVS
jgi:Tfp pilus assembly protein FimT